MTQSPANPPSAQPDLGQLADLTARYASYSRSAGGLSSVVGGVLCALAFGIGAWVPLGTELRYVLACAPLLWLAGKEALRHFYYQRSGLAAEKISPKLRRMRWWMTVYLTLMSALIIGGVVGPALHSGEFAPLLHKPGLAYIAIVAAVPMIAHRWFWSASDFLVGVLLFCQAAVVLAGGNYPPLWIAVAGAFAFIAIASGLREHRDYLQLRRELGLDGARS